MKIFFPALLLFSTILSAETRFILPWVTHNQDFQATLIINNLGTTPAEVRLHDQRIFSRWSVEQGSEIPDILYI